MQVVDGWEFNGELFPSVKDHEKGLESRFHEFCGRRRIRKSFQSSQNAALIQYRIPMFGQGFSVRVQHVVNPRRTSFSISFLLNTCMIMTRPECMETGTYFNEDFSRFSFIY